MGAHSDIHLLYSDVEVEIEWVSRGGSCKKCFLNCYIHIFLKLFFYKRSVMFAFFVQKSFLAGLHRSVLA